MKRLTKAEKMVLGTYDKQTDTVSRPEGLDDRQFAAALFALEEQGLASIAGEMGYHND